MNIECDLILRFFYMRRNEELFILTSGQDDKVDDGDEEWTGIISKINGFMKEETKIITNMFNEKLDKLIGDSYKVEG